MLTLQVNASGAWRHVMPFGPDERAQVEAAVVALHEATGRRYSWAVLVPRAGHPQGRREVIVARDPEAVR